MSLQDLYDLVSLACIFGVFAVSLNLLVGWSGIPAVAPTAFGALGGYLAGYFAIYHGVTFIPALVIGTLASAALGLFLSATALRLSIENIILLTVALGSIVLSVATAIPALGGPNGLVSVPYAHLFGMQFDSSLRWMPLLVVFLVATYAITYWLGESPMGLSLKGVREDESAVRSVGLNPVPPKVAVFTISSGFAGLGGVLLVYYNNVASPNSFGFNQGILIVTMIIIGGLGRPGGPIAGAVLVVLLPKVLEWVINLSPSQSVLLQQIIYGVVLIAAMLFRPSGLIAEKPLRVVRRYVRRRLAEQRPQDAETDLTAIAEDVELEAATGPQPGPDGRTLILRAHALQKRFGGLVVANGFDFELPAGEVIGLVGPNGAGKTTLFNLLTGAIRPDSGSVELMGRDISNGSMDSVAQAGMARSFQDVRLFNMITLFENVLLGAIPARSVTLWRTVFTPGVVRRDLRVALDETWSVLERLNLQDRSLVLGSGLSYGERKIGAIGRLIATKAKVLLLDEPAAGVGPELAEAILRVITSLREEGHTILLVEHNLEVVRDVATSVYFLESGRIRAHGTYDELISDPVLADIYFGAGHTQDALARADAAPPPPAAGPVPEPAAAVPARRQA
jgi:branched-chain amino acid transport system permease protein